MGCLHLGSGEVVDSLSAHINVCITMFYTSCSALHVQLEAWQNCWHSDLASMRTFRSEVQYW